MATSSISSPPDRGTTSEAEQFFSSSPRSPFYGPEADSGFDFLGGHESFRTVLTRVLRPNGRNSHFRCHVFSASGNFMATGETNGTLRLWSTRDYGVIWQRDNLVPSSIEALAFVDQSEDDLIIVNDQGEYMQFRIHIDPPQLRRSVSIAIDVTNVRHGLLGLEPLAIHHDRQVFQFSADGRTLAFYEWEEDDPPNLIGVGVWRFGADESQKLRIAGCSSDFTVPTLSDNGQGMLLCNFRNAIDARCSSMRLEGSSDLRTATSITVFPRLDFRAKHQHKVSFPGELASWALGGKYVLVWRTEEKVPCLEVHETARMLGLSLRHQKINERRLRLGLSSWNACMLKSEREDSSPLVLISEVSTSGRRWFVFWDFGRNVVTREVNMHFFSMRSVGSRTESLVGDPLEPVGTEEEWTEQQHMRNVMSNAFPAFSCSREGEWLAAYSPMTGSCAVSSVQSGVTVWAFDVPECFQLKPECLPVQALFDPSGEHFVMTSDSVIIVGAPCFLQKPGEIVSCTTHDPRDLRNYSPNDSHYSGLLETYQALPSGALAYHWGGSRHRKPSSSQKGSSNSRSLFDDSVVGIALDSDRNVAIIERDVPSARSRVLVTKIGHPNEEASNTSNALSSLSFPISIDGRASPFSPQRIFLYKDKNDATAVVLLSRDAPMALFFIDLAKDTCDAVVLEYLCLKLSQTKDGSKLVIVDVDCVRLYDLKRRRCIQTISYQVNFVELLSHANHDLRWNGNPERERTLRDVSDDGETVLLAWDNIGQLSIVVDPRKTHEEVEEEILGGNGMLSNGCSITVDGSCTCFVDVDSLNGGDIVIGVFNQSSQRVVSRVSVIRQLPIRESDNLDLQNWVLGNVHFGISKDAKELVVATTGLRTRLHGLSHSKDSICRFSIYDTMDSIPHYNCTNEDDANEIEHKIHDLCQKHGLFVYNTPTASGMTLFQESLKAKNTGMEHRIIEKAKKYQWKMALEWKERNTNEEKNLLALTVRRRSKTNVAELLTLICSDSTPFGSGARIIKNNFLDLSANYRETIESALTSNLFVAEATTLNVHVNFLERKWRQNMAVHIRTTDTYLGWTHVTDPDALEKNWDMENDNEVAKMETEYQNSRSSASLRYIQIEDAAMPGMRGIVRPLLMQSFPADYFRCDVVKWVVLFKWFHIWKQRFFLDALRYFLFLISFTVYAVLIAASAHPEKETATWKSFVTGLLILNLLFGVWMFNDECRQIRRNWSDGEKYFGNPLKGIWYYLGFVWNWVDMISSILLVVLIPISHILSLYMDAGNKTQNHMLSVFIALEAIVVTCKVWYYAQPFRVSGALVRMTREIVKDCLPFLVLSFVMLFGFALSLHTLFRHVRRNTEDGEEMDEEKMDECVDEAVKAYGTFPSSLLSLFYALVGSIDQSVYRCDPDLHGITKLIFATYMIATTIVLLNLLISIMGDTFDRVKNHEEAQLLMGRARFIDSAEATLCQTELEKLEKMTERYVCVLLNPDQDFDETTQSKWIGKLKTLENSFKETVEEGTNGVSKMLQDQRRFISDKRASMIDAIQELYREKNDDMIQKQNAINHAMMQKLDYILERLDGGAERRPQEIPSDT